MRKVSPRPAPPAAVISALALVVVPADAARKPARDTTAPSLSIAAPTAGATLNGTFSVSGSSSDNVSVAKVEVSVDGAAYRLAAGTTSWSL